MGALEPTQSVGQGGVGTPELLAQAGKFKAQSASFILYTIQIASVKVNKMQEIRSVSIAFEKPAPFTSFYAPFPHCLNRRFLLSARGQSRGPSARPKQGAPEGPTLTPTLRKNPVLLSLIQAPFGSDPHLTILRRPQAPQKRLRATNGLERVNQKLK